MKRINRLKKLIKEIVSEEMPISSHLVAHTEDVIPYK